MITIRKKVLKTHYSGIWKYARGLINTVGNLVFIIQLCTGIIICGCTSKNKDNSNNNTFVHIFLNNQKSDTSIFCRLGISSKLVENHVTLNEPLAFSPTELQKILIEDQYSYSSFRRPVGLPKFDSILYLIGYNNLNNKVICFDANNNGRFDDDSVYIIKNEMPYIKISGIKTYLSKLEQINRDYYIKPDGYALLTGKAILRTFFFSKPIYYSGVININSKDYVFNVFNNSLSPFYPSAEAQLVVYPLYYHLRSCEDKMIKYKIGDTLYFNKTIYQWNNISLDGRTLRLKYLGGQTKQFGVEVNNFSFPITGINLMTGKAYNTDTSHKYLLLDFWGTWCTPCKALTPELIELGKIREEKKFEIISIAYDDSKEDVIKYITKNQMNWVHFFDDRKTNGISSKYKIDSYPTFILIDAKGKIISRGIGRDALLAIKKTLLEKIQ